MKHLLWHKTVSCQQSNFGKTQIRKIIVWELTKFSHNCDLGSHKKSVRIAAELRTASYTFNINLCWQWWVHQKVDIFTEAVWGGCFGTNGIDSLMTQVFTWEIMIFMSLYMNHKSTMLTKNGISFRWNWSYMMPAHCRVSIHKSINTSSTKLHSV